MAEIRRRAFVIGHPVGHSRSPLIHGHWLSRYGIAGTYERLDLEPGRLRQFMSDLAGSDFVGGNITIPHKEAAFELISDLDSTAASIGAVNTVWIEDGRPRGGNTDAYGFAANLDDIAPRWRQAGRACVLGAGGGARAVLFALREARIGDIRLVNRNRERAEELARRFGPDIGVWSWSEAEAAMEGAQLLVNTTSLGMAGSPFPDLDLTGLDRNAIVTDIVYVPLETALLYRARMQGLTTVDGLGMLLHQAVPGFERWFGVRPEVDAALRRILIADMEPAP
jgi:shikimate dehydrogenase